MNTTKMPKTVHELILLAKEMGLTASELLADFERTLGERWFEADSDITTSAVTVDPSPVVAAPEGFIQARDALQPDLPADHFDGPSETGDGWRIETTFTFERGVTFELLALDFSPITMLTDSQAIAAGNALAALAAKYAVPQGA